MKIILLNGPPRSGKDTAARVIMRNLKECRHYKLSEPMKRSINQMFQLVGNDLQNVELHKDTPLPLFNNHTYRNIQIEQFLLMEKLFGTDILGQMAALRIKGMATPCVVISDAGRNEEVKPIIEAFGSRSVYCLFLSRPDTSYNKDIRQYLRAEQFMPSHIANIDNVHDLELFETQVIRVLKKWEMIQ